ncbi:E3 ubiquitin-protein ligase PRT1 isoform X1 [Arachis duranensis]|uniref:E3 ubiquitin-protein ligase PRT1 isoform X1 n=1 Tax=Arachis duranensis TaxID=130453 RepID=A0A6P4DMX7_ARADU|nr:E3 ubiquitin-protein ligase PRT1 isoform X1 [Arachis duranensis]
MEANAAIKESEQHDDEISDSFVCCVCLELLHKPIVLACGHLSCFWCVHKSMDVIRESHCPICRQSYYHFPTICQMLHFLLLKLYPDAYKRRLHQVLEEEKELGYFSPQFDDDICGSQAKIDNPESSHSSATKDPSSNSSNLETCECKEQSGSSNHEGKEGAIIYEDTSNRMPEVMGTTSIAGKKVPENDKHNQQQKITIADVTCTKCKQLLFHPIVLNCGHVFCEVCMMNIDDQVLKCQICQSLHPRGFPKVCLALDHFLKEQFPEEYAKRRDASQFSQVKVKPKISSCSSGNGEAELSGLPSRIHIGVGCDFCGMYPIIGERYKCIDCKEEIGFDLCGDCHKTHSKLPGRFNQQHTPEHRFESVQGFRSVGGWYAHESLEISGHVSEDPSSPNEVDEDFQTYIQRSSLPDEIDGDNQNEHREPL